MSVTIIKWERLKRIASKIINMPVEIHLTTILDSNYRAAMTINKQNIVIILLNAKYNKSEKDIIESLAHELSHIYVKKHDNKFYTKAKELEKIIKDQYYKS